MTGIDVFAPRSTGQDLPVGTCAQEWTDRIEAGQPVEIRARRRKHWRILVSSTAFVAIGLTIALTSDRSVDRAAGWVCAVFFALPLALVLAVLRHRRPAVVVDGEGIGASPGDIVVPWRDARGADVVARRWVRVLTDADPVTLPGPLVVPAGELADWLTVEIRRRHPSAGDAQS